MIFDSKQYLYHKVKDYKLSDESILLNTLDLLGDFKIRPGSLKYQNDSEPNPNSYLKSNSFTLANENIECSSFIYGLNNLIINGSFDNNQVLIKIEGLKPAYDVNPPSLTMSVIDNSKGIYVFKSNSINLYSTSWSRLPHIIHYDKEALDTLINDYGLSINELLEYTDHDLKKLGFIPDSVTASDETSLKDTSIKDFIKTILNEITYEELINSFTKTNNIENLKLYQKEKK